MARRLALVAAVTASVLVAPPWARAAPEDGPRISVEQDPTGTFFQVTGDGWTPSTLVNLELCGNEGLDGSVDCDATNAQIVGTDRSGHFGALLPMAVPPSPCPCVVRALAQTIDQSATAPVEVPGAVTALPGDRDVGTSVRRQLSIESVSLTGSGPWTAWLGGSPERTLTLTVSNVGDVTVEDAILNLWVGVGDEPKGYVPPIKVDPLEPGESATYQVEIELGLLTFGERTVAGQIRGIGEPTTFSTTTTSYPWLLMILPLAVIVQSSLVAGRNRLRRRLHAAEEAPAAAAEEQAAIGEEMTAEGEPTTDESLPAVEDEPAADAEPAFSEAAQVAGVPVPPPPVRVPITPPPPPVRVPITPPPPPVRVPITPPPPPVRVPITPPPPPPPANGGVIRPVPAPLPGRTKALEPVAARAHVFSRLDRD